ncbi:septal ring lytic transglycosylase RlpA family protein [Hippea alviniae]|uniref:septal ring lytic transglycosylase RlpA family protein n=1 Tax=Hippea alviniae TaxID=1279027 RepID=UPI0003B593CB|nr:septal ring lytic transglycosylase RlpA family protein [Hippea alviniae]
MRLKELLGLKYTIRAFIFFVFAFLLSSCSVLRSSVYTGGYYPYRVLKSVPKGYTQIGIASWYGPKFQGRRTANGEIYNMYAHTAASKTLPFNTIVKVINLNNGRSTIVRINDRGPFVKNRIIDLSYAAAKDIGMIGTGTAPVKVIVLGSAPSVTMFKNSATIKRPKVEQLDKITIDTNIDVNIGDFAVQVGSFRSLLNALRLKDRLSKSLSDVYIQRKIVNGIVFYRVLVGDFDTKEEAERFALNAVASIVGSYCIVKK